MAITLGIDTGGTYTDAVLIRDDRDVLATAKALTTRQDLAIGVGQAVEAVLERSDVAAGQIAMAALSTTLATNALVEGQGGRVALVYIGFREGDLDRHGLRDALRGDPALVVAGGHSHAGTEVAALDRDAVQAFLAQVGDQVTGFAVAAQFATRNPAHELAVAQMIRDQTGLPVTCSHHLSAKLNGPKRAVTAVLNARLVGMIDALIGRAEARLVELGVAAPMMVVRGDGALMSAAQARVRPIETILSGPAASIVGARWLTGVQDALVSDIGGTTTDVALIREGRPAIDPGGAHVGGFRTMVEAVAMRTTGLGGDSEVHLNAAGLQGGVVLGPRRVVPVALMAQAAPGVVLPALEVQGHATTPGEYDGLFVRLVPGVSHAGLDARATQLVERIGDGVHPLADILRTRMEQGALGRLRDRGIVQVSGLTPSDAAHVLGLLDSWDAQAARMAADLFCRRRVGTGDRVAQGAEPLARMIIDQLQAQTALALLEAGFAEDPGFDGDAGALARHVLMQRGMEAHAGVIRIAAGLNLPVVGLGASAPTYYPAVGDRLGTQMILPDHAGVANAIGAVAGRITMRRTGSITAPSEGRFRVHLPDGPQDFAALDPALTCMETHLRQQALDAARAAGADDIELTVTRDIRTAQAEAREVFVEASLTVEASGRPRVAT